MAGFPVVQAFQALSLVADSLPNFNLPTPVYAVLASDTFLPLFIPDSWREFAMSFDSATTDAPMETGAFQVYHIVQRPTQIRIGVTKEGSDLARYAWLSAILQFRAQAPTQLYTILAPEGVFVDYKLSRVRFDKSRGKGSNILYLDLEFEEVPAVPASLQTDGSTVFDNAVDAKSSPVAQVGRVFTNATTAAQNVAAQASKLFTY